MTNDTPPRACLADFGFMTMVLDPVQPMACSAQLEGGTTTFMAPELLAPSKYGTSSSAPTPESDIYAFGLVIFQVREQDRKFGRLLILSRSLQEKPHSVVFGRPSWVTLRFRGCARTNQ